MNIIWVLYLIGGRLELAPVTEVDGDCFLLEPHEFGEYCECQPECGVNLDGIRYVMHNEQRAIQTPEEYEANVRKQIQ